MEKLSLFQAGPSVRSFYAGVRLHRESDSQSYRLVGAIFELEIEFYNDGERHPGSYEGTPKQTIEKVAKEFGISYEELFEGVQAMPGETDTRKRIQEWGLDGLKPTQEKKRPTLEEIADVIENTVEGTPTRDFADDGVTVTFIIEGEAKASGYSVEEIIAALPKDGEAIAMFKKYG